jgi:pantetheine-phosphate adenylyltransferase
MKSAIYPLSADPITFGHFDIIKRAQVAFDEVIVAIGNNPAKKYLFTLEERTNMATRALQHLSNVKVVSFTGMLSDFVYEQNIHFVIRGIRNSEDFNYEIMLHQVLQTQDLGIETFFLPCSQDKTHISSGASKAIQLEQGMIHQYVSLNVKKALEERLSGQYFVGVTGTIGAGKSTYCKQRVQEEQQKGNEAHHIDLDKIGHEILEKKTEPLYVNLRKELANLFGLEILNEAGFINRPLLGNIVFNNPDKLKLLNETLRTPILTLLRRTIHGLKGLILIEGALLIEAELTFLCNNEVILLKVDQDVQFERLQQRGLNPEQILRRIESQYTYEKKKELLEAVIAKDGFGEVMEE